MPGRKIPRATTGSRNSAIGYQSLKAVTTSSDNSAFGYNSGLLFTDVQGTFFGSQAGSNATTATNFATARAK